MRTLPIAVLIALPTASVMIWTVHAAMGPCAGAVLGLLTLAGVAGVVRLFGIRSRIGAGIERTLFPTRRAARDALLRFSANVVNRSCCEDLEKQLLRTLMDSLRLRGVALYLKDQDSDDFSLACSEGGIHAPKLVQGASLLPNGPLPSLVRMQERSVRAMAQDLGWDAYVPVWADETCLGWIALAPGRLGTALCDFDATLLTVVAAQLAVALKNAEYVREIERQKAALEECKKRLETGNVTLRTTVRSCSQFKEIIGSSSGLQRALALVEKIAPSDASILITGETGTGKELIAQAIHAGSARQRGPLISVNCSAIPRELAESELFGHERGAFTDAVSDRPGKFELAHGGTIFLDEIADLPLELQAKLLRVLQEHETQRLGGRTVHRLDLRVVAATNRDLHAEMRNGSFREDLYYRLAAVVVHLPPLRERVDDIPMLANYFFVSV